MMITSQDLFLILFLAFLEGILSIDNALVLAMMARGVPGPLQRKALTYGLIGSVIFRIIALSLRSLTLLIRRLARKRRLRSTMRSASALI